MDDFHFPRRNGAGTLCRLVGTVTLVAVVWASIAVSTLSFTGEYLDIDYRLPMSAVCVAGVCFLVDCGLGGGRGGFARFLAALLIGLVLLALDACNILISDKTWGLRGMPAWSEYAPGPRA